MKTFALIDRRQRLVAFVVAIALGSSALWVVLLPFADAGRRPWFAFDAPLGAEGRPCQRALPAAQRRACLKMLAQASMPASTGIVVASP